MTVDAPFSYPAGPLDRTLLAAGQAERLARGALRQLRAGRFEVPARSGAPASAGEATSEGTEGAPILYLPAVAWGYRFQRPQHLALALARAGHPVLYVDGFLRSRLLPARCVIHQQGDLQVLRVRVPGRPDPYRQALDEKAARRLANTLLAGLRREPLAVLVQLPFWAALGRELSQRLGVPLVYDRIDFHAGFPGVPEEIAKVESDLIARADLVCATAGPLVPDAASRTLLLRNAVDLASFSPRRSRTPGKTVGYVGALGPWFDAAAVAEAARRHPEWRFRLAGRVEDPEAAALAALPNVELAGEIPFREVPGFLSDTDVALVPFKDLPLTRAVDPVKLYEALALGLPVVARRLPETERWAEPLVYLYDAPGDLAGQVERALAAGAAASPETARERRRAAEGESWDRRASELLAMIKSRPQ
jgi:glycosyltransferase involved in cell wall biosynthesis